MRNDLFSQEFDFSDDLDKLLKELETDAVQPPPKTFAEFLRDWEKQEESSRIYFPVKGQFVKATTIYRHIRCFAKDLFATFRLSLKTDGVFQMTVSIDHPLELPYNEPTLHHLLWAIRNADQFSIYPIEKQYFTLVFRLQLYQVIPFPQ